MKKKERNGDFVEQFDEMKAYVNLSKKRIEAFDVEIDHYKQWIIDLLNDEETTISLNICAYAGKLATAISAKKTLERDLGTFKDYCLSDETD